MDCDPRLGTVAIAFPALLFFLEPMSFNSSLQNIVQELERHQDVIRIKKLLIYTAEKRWENSLFKLQKVPLDKLITGIIAQFPSENSLRTSISKAVQSLSRPEAYNRIAYTILLHVIPLYESREAKNDFATFIKDDEDETSPGSQPDKSEVVGGISLASQQLASHPETIRIKKLLYAICKGRWENDVQKLGQAPFVELLQTLKNIHPQLLTFEQSLNELVNSLNRQSYYRGIASAMLEYVAPLYEDTAMTTQMIDIPQFMDRGQRRPTEPSYPNKEDVFVAQHPIEHIANGNQQNSTVDSLIPVAIKAPEVVQNLVEKLDIYRLKLEIIKYTNPLRAKILLFSILYHPFNPKGQDWSLLKTCDLDDLLLKAIAAHPTVADLESKLTATAQALFDPEEHLQAVSTIIQAITLLTDKS